MGAGNSTCPKIGCTDPNCNLCTSASVCIQCDYLNNYYVSGGNCLICNNGANMFINMTDTSYPCVSCGIVGCTTCVSLIKCMTCNNGGGYWLHPTTQLC
jgi:hypothetical protein